MLDVSDPKPGPVRSMPVDIISELNIIHKKHGIKAPSSLLEELASLYLDPPPWNPWTK